jgi:thiol-disulfide isomerase/thioredoxin
VTRAWFLALALVACSRKEEPARSDHVPAPSASAQPPQGPLVMAPKDQLRTISAPDGEDVAAIVRDAMKREAQEGRRILVYIGATWCEPCQRFHAAANKGLLDASFPNLTLLEFDADKDGERLLNAGYGSRLIPYFGVPGPDGRATGKHLEGSVKGDGAVNEIAPRLKKLLE